MMIDAEALDVPALRQKYFVGWLAKMKPKTEVYSISTIQTKVRNIFANNVSTQLFGRIVQ
jgi:hypothetical protein